MGHEFVLDQFEAGESISEVPSIIGAILPVDLGVGHGKYVNLAVFPTSEFRCALHAEPHNFFKNAN